MIPDWCQAPGRGVYENNLFYWVPEFVTVRMFRSLFKSRYAEVAFSLHAAAAHDEFEELAADFQSLASSVHG